MLNSRIGGRGGPGDEVVMLENDAGGGEEPRGGSDAFLFDDPKGESARLRLIVGGLLFRGIRLLIISLTIKPLGHTQA